MSDVPGREVSGAGAQARITLRPIATPLPLGFLGLVAATAVVSGLELGWIPARERPEAALVLVAFAAPLQGLATVFGFLDRDPAAGTGMGALAAGWLVIGLLMRAPGGTVDGYLAVVAGLVLAVPAIASLSGKPLAAAVIGGAGARHVLSGIAELAHSTAWRHTAGVAGLAIGALALYAALAFELEAASGRPVLPTLRRDAGSRAPDGRELEREPGVRSEL